MYSRRWELEATELLFGQCSGVAEPSDANFFPFICRPRQECHRREFSSASSILIHDKRTDEQDRSGIGRSPTSGGARLQH